jgi:cell division protein FtsW (lipid II flippase)
MASASAASFSCASPSSASSSVRCRIQFLVLRLILIYFVLRLLPRVGGVDPIILLLCLLFLVLGFLVTHLSLSLSRWLGGGGGRRREEEFFKRRDV